MKNLSNFIIIGIIVGLSFSSCVKEQLFDNKEIIENKKDDQPLVNNNTNNTEEKDDDENSGTNEGTDVNTKTTEEESTGNPTSENEGENTPENTNTDANTKTTEEENADNPMNENEGENTPENTNTDTNTKITEEKNTDNPTNENEGGNTSENTKANTGYWKIANTEYELTSCVIVEYGSRGNGFYDIEIHLYTGTLREQADARLNGSGNRLRLSLISSSKTLAAGTYLHSNTVQKEGTLEDLRSNYGLNYTNYNNRLPSNPVVQFQSGKVEVKLINEECIIEFSLVSDKGEKISGIHKGAYTRYIR